VIQNNSGYWTACHLRLRAWRYSIEVYDHVILLSPYDVFYFSIVAQPEDETITMTRMDGATMQWTVEKGLPMLVSTDTETLRNSGLVIPGTPGYVVDGYNENRTVESGPNAGDFAVLYHYNDYGSSTSTALWKIPLSRYLLEDCGVTKYHPDVIPEMQAGYIEVIGLWQLSRTPGLPPNSPWLPPNHDNENTANHDTHDLINIVNPANYPDAEAIGSNIVNVFDVQDALFYDSAKLPAVNGTSTPGARGWPTQVLIELTERGTDTIIRYGIDCGNVLSGAFEMGDPNTGRYGLVNAVALRDFRTDVAAGSDAHRDGYDGGAIVYPTAIMNWALNGFSDYYVNENWTITAGAGLRDGDDILGENVLPYGVRTAPGPDINPAGELDWFNDIWSLDDVENALRKMNISYQFFSMTYNDGNLGNIPMRIDTDAVFTFPTKHYHFFYEDWPFYEGSLYTSTGLYVNAVTNYRRNTAEGIPNTSIYDRLERVYKLSGGPEGVSGNITPQPNWASIFDMDQNKYAPPEEPTGSSLPPGSPWPPPGEVTSERYIPNEVNILRIGKGLTDTKGIDAGNYALYAQGMSSGASGHFISGPFYLRTGQRGIPFSTGEYETPRNPKAHGIYFESLGSDPTVYLLPPIGFMIYDHSDPNDTTWVRSAMSDWHYQEGPGKIGIRP
jgi:hypothetical protein